MRSRITGTRPSVERKIRKNLKPRRTEPHLCDLGDVLPHDTEIELRLPHSSAAAARIPYDLPDHSHAATGKQTIHKWSELSLELYHIRACWSKIKQDQLVWD